MCYVWVAYAAAAVIGAYSAYTTNENQQEVAKYNSKIAGQNAANQQQVTLQQEWQQREKVRRALSGQMADDVKSGFITNTGTPLLVAQESARNGELDALTVRYAGQQKEYQYRTQSNLDAFESSAYAQAKYLSAGSALLNGYTSGSQAAVW